MKLEKTTPGAGGHGRSGALSLYSGITPWQALSSGRVARGLFQTGKVVARDGAIGEGWKLLVSVVDAAPLVVFPDQEDVESVGMRAGIAFEVDLNAAVRREDARTDRYAAYRRSARRASTQMKFRA